MYDGATIIAEYDASGNVLRRTVHGLSGPMVWYEGAGTSSHRWLIPDERGSIIARDNAGAVSINTYDEYGNNGSSNAGRFQYVGLPWIAEAGLYQMGARAYSPSLGRWMQTDPILTAGGVNLYAYVGNDPVNLFDPSGLDVVCDASGRNCSETGHGEEVMVTSCPLSSVCGEAAQEFLGGLRDALDCLDCRPHFYAVENIICIKGGACDAQNVFQCLRENPAPGVGGTAIDNGSTDAVPGLGPVTHVVDPTTRSIANITAEGHALYPGVVLRSVNDRGFFLSVGTIGAGDGPLATLNEALAVPVWSAQSLIISSCVSQKKG